MHSPLRTLSKSARCRPRVAFIAWSTVGGRSEEIAAALGGEARCFNDLRIVTRWLIPLRYAVSAVRTVAYLARRRPRALIVTNPPVFPGLIAMAYSRLTGATVVLDSHPSAYGVNRDAMALGLLPVSRWLAARAASSLVTGPDLVSRTKEWGGRADVLHEAPPSWTLAPLGHPKDRPRILCVGRFAHDEPTDMLVEAAGLVPEYDVEVTGDLRNCPAGLRECAPPNVSFVGFLHGADYLAALERADLVVALSKSQYAVSRAASEAVWARRPLMVSAWPLARDAFPYAVYVDNDRDTVAGGLRAAIERRSELISVAEAARKLQLRRWETQLEVLRELVGIEVPRESGRGERSVLAGRASEVIDDSERTRVPGAARAGSANGGLK